MPKTGLMALAVPTLGLVLLWELWVSMRSEDRLYHASHTASDVLCGALRLAVGLLGKGVMVAGFAAAYSQRVFTLPGDSPWVWAAALLGYDFLYYWAHRVSHRVRFFWASHQVHHQPQHYNLGIGLRQGMFGALLGLPFFLPLAILGVPPGVYVALVVGHAVLMFWLHSASRLGLRGWWLNSPGHHAIHHSRETKHFGKNLGGILLVWDRLFGTYSAPEPVVKFGLSDAAPRRNPIAANSEPWIALFDDVRAAEGWTSKWITFWGRPGQDAAPAVAEGRGSTFEIAAVVLTLLAVALGASEVDWTWSHVLLLPLALLLLDFLSGVVHWFFDHHVTPSTSFLGRIAYDFQDHHVRPRRTAEVGFFKSAFRVTFLAVPLLFVAAVWASSAPFLTVFVALSLFAPQVHKWTHMRSPPRAVQWLWRTGVIMDRRGHAIHHGKGQDKAFCIVTGWCNAPLDRVGFWRALDRFMVCVRREDRRRADPGLEDAPETAAGQRPSDTAGASARGRGTRNAAANHGDPRRRGGGRPLAGRRRERHRQSGDDHDGASDLPHLIQRRLALVGWGQFVRHPGHARREPTHGIAAKSWQRAA